MERIYFDRDKLKFRSISERLNQVSIVDQKVENTTQPGTLPAKEMAAIRQTALDIVIAKNKGASSILTFGTHLIRNGLGPLIGEFMRRRWITHLATTGTSVIDDWEFAFQGAGCEDTKTNLIKGEFGMWQESSYLLNLAILIGAWRNLGLGEALGCMIVDEEIIVPDKCILRRDISNLSDANQVAASADLLEKLEKFNIPAGRIEVCFPYREYSLLYNAQRSGIPLTVHPMFGLDVMFMHPLNSFAATGRTAETDFLYFVNNVDNLENGIYMSVGSSVASPMIFEKALSMSQNVRLQEGRRMTQHKIIVVDLAESKWDWMTDGEPPENRPEYYLRYCKSFSRAKAKSMYYISADNRDFFLHLYRELNEIDRK